MLKSNTTFSVLNTSNDWRTDITLRFCEYAANQLHGVTFRDFINLPSSVDEALSKCQTPYLIVIQPGYLPLTKNFFTKLEERIKLEQDIFLGHIYLVEDYAIIDPKFIMFNMELWRKYGQQPYAVCKTPVKQFTVSQKASDRDWPNEIIADAHDTQIAEPFCRERGAALISKQMERFSTCISVSALAPEDCHFIDDSTALSEILTETEFELIHLPAIKNTVRLISEESLDDIPAGFSTDLLVSVAHGLRTLDIAQAISPKKIIIFSENPHELELQKRIFGVTSPKIYGDIIDEFIDNNLEATVEDILEKNRYLIVSPVKAEIEYRLITTFSFQLFDLIRSIHHNTEAVFDLSDEFIRPSNFYRRPMYQVRGLFATLYSDIRSRTGVTKIFGFSPGFKNMNGVVVNSSNAAFEFSNSSVELKQTIEKPQIFRPECSPQIKQKLVAKSMFSKMKDVLSAPPVPTDTQLENTKLATSWISRALRMGYVVDTTNSDPALTVIFKRTEPVNGIKFVYFYEINARTNKWSFRVGMAGSRKRVLVNDGTDQGMFLAHLLRESKFDPVATAKLLGK